MVAVAIDTETFLVAPGRQAPPVVCLTSASDTGQPLIMHGKDPALVELVRAQLESGDLIVGHNIAYDLACLANEHPELMPLIFDALDRDLIADTMICQRLIDIATDTEFDPATRKRVRYSLAALAERLLGETVAGKAGGDVWRVRYHELYDVPLRSWPQPARDYALNDAALTLRIWHVQSQALPPDLFPQVRYAFGFQLM
ncbi:MAG: hypothetical protein EBT13_13360, partial [Rhodobacteraceae bacterium]|nr:hypothetical protein [Paracoccaceae bacterium]